MGLPTQTSAERQAHDRVRAGAVHPAGTYIDFTPRELLDSPAGLFERHASQNPDAQAIVTGDGCWTYSALNSWANGIARVLLADSHAEAGPVGLLIDNSPAMVASVLAALKAGRTFVPVDPATTPMDRMHYILQDSGASLVLTTGAHLDLAKRAIGGLDALDVGALEQERQCENPDTKPGADDVAWLIYTSGSTGRPKGVAQTYATIMHFLATESAAYHICPDDRYAVSFSSSVNMWYRVTLSALVKGASIYPVDMDARGFSGLSECLTEHEITLFAQAPSLFRQFAVTVRDPLPHLRVVKLIGEPTLRTDVDLYQRFFPRSCVLINRYGTTETAPVRYYFMDHDSEVSSAHAPIGYPVPGSDLLLLDSDGAEVTRGEAGEIVIRSQHLAASYWNRPEITDATFKPDPHDDSQRLYLTGDVGSMGADGCVLHLGRKDHQVQIRGYRVELAEIEITIRELEEVADGAVSAVSTGEGETYLVGYVVPNGPTPPVSLLRDQISAKLPSYMIPSHWVFLDEFPRGENGKLLRKALPAVEAVRAETPEAFVEPATPMERRVAKNWKKVLRHVDRIGVNDRFFDLGGDSLAAMQVLTWLERETGVQLNPIDMARQTLGQIASVYDRLGIDTPRPSAKGSTGPLGLIRRIFGGGAA